MRLGEPEINYLNKLIQDPSLEYTPFFTFKNGSIYKGMVGDWSNEYKYIYIYI